MTFYARLAFLFGDPLPPCPSDEERALADEARFKVEMSASRVDRLARTLTDAVEQSKGGDE